MPPRTALSVSFRPLHLPLESTEPTNPTKSDTTQNTDQPAEATEDNTDDDLENASGKLRRKERRSPVATFRLPEKLKRAQNEAPAKQERYISPWDIVAHSGSENVPSKAPAYMAPNEHLKQPIPSDLNSFDELYKLRSLPRVRRLSRLTDRVHVLGFTSHAKFVAHALASTKGRPPVQIVAYHPIAEQQWGVEDRSLSLYNRKHHISDVTIPCPEKLDAPKSYPGNFRAVSQNIDNLVVDTLSAAVIPSLRQLRHRIDRRTSICLLHPGLGLAEHIIDELFPDEDTRPNFIIGQSSHKISKMSPRKLSIRQVDVGHINIHGLSLDNNPRYASDRVRQTQNFIEVLRSSEDLNVKGLALPEFLRWKLHTILFCSVADTLSVVLGCSYRKIKENPYAMWLWESLLDEGMDIISRLPEFEARPWQRDKVTRRGFRTNFMLHLNSLRLRTSPWIAQVRIGREPPMDYFNGYLIRRADELGLDHKYNSMVLAMAKAKFSSRVRELNAGIPLGMTPYMMDEDLIGGGQALDSSEYVDLDEDF
ncbi:hypothetical protein F5Y16DRAFT_424488 [Xylariaceae sp. FL0255]|nr:hypothetical protein F5Y16DRAFT_424488 [Xylariaceae sp. FL0255]